MTGALRWHAQRYRPEGSVASDGIKKQLGTPQLDPLDVLVREAAQNSWDARLETKPSIHFALHFRTISGRALADWRRIIGAGDHLESFRIDKAMAGDSVTMLTVSDRRTTGLGGPTRSDEATDESPDFVNFVRNVGEPRDTDQGGGTYGFGKGSLFNVARSDAILVDTQCVVQGVVERRLIGSALGTAFNAGGSRFTGRHFWGRPDRDIVDPLLDDEAASIAHELGLKGFEASETGTDITIIGVDLGTRADTETQRTVEQGARHAASACLWNLWPKLADFGGGPAIELVISVDGEPLEVPRPEDVGRIKPFVDALAGLREGGGVAQTRKSAPFVVGHFNAEANLAAVTPDVLVDSAAPFDGPAHHCARMRPVELVVDYVAGPEVSLSGVHVGAVYRAHKDADDYFAEAEPPTHDDWVTRHLSGTARGVVTAAKTFVKSQLDEALARYRSDTGSAAQVPLGGLASRLAKSLPSAVGTGAGSATPRSPGASGRGKARQREIRLVEEPRLRVEQGEAQIVAVYEFEPSTETRVFVIEADPVADGARERTAPAGAELPEPLRWETPDGEFRLGSYLELHAADPRRWTAVVRAPSDAATRLAVKRAAS